MNLEQKPCPFCGGTAFVEAAQHGGAKVRGERAHAAALHHIICLACGSVVRSFVKHPEKLAKKALRAEKNAERSETPVEQEE